MLKFHSKSSTLTNNILNFNGVLFNGRSLEIKKLNNGAMAGMTTSPSTDAADIVPGINCKYNYLSCKFI